jgi:holliday junction DNA helicase RuvA
MIAALCGVVIDRMGATLTVDVQGVGYEVTCSAACLELAQHEQEIRMVIFTDVKEDSIRLYGFSDKLEKQVFLLLTRVKGVGAKSASEMISRVDKIGLLRLIGQGDVDQLCRVKGIGKKTAERIIVELKDKVGEFIREGVQFETLSGNSRLSASVETSVYSISDEAVAALEALGFSRKHAEAAVAAALQNVPSESASKMGSSSELIREALRHV